MTVLLLHMCDIRSDKEKKWKKRKEMAEMENLAIKVESFKITLTG